MNPTTPRHLLITGATGGIGLLLTQRLRTDYKITQHGRTPKNDEQQHTLAKADLTDYNQTLNLMTGIDTVIHLAGASSPESTWDEVLNANIIGTRNILEAARNSAVRRIVYASSNHALGMYDRYSQWPTGPHTLPRADSLYGVSKIFGETLGRFYHDEYGLDFIALRIGWSVPDPTTTDEDLLHAMWLSPDDTEQIFRCAIETTTTFGLYYAISNNNNRRWDITNTLLDLGYRPKDSWEDHDPHPQPPVEGGITTRLTWPIGS
ncbi:Uncharacterized epimerase/dehydratase SAV0553 [Dermatophilus congolensis]|uniref:Uncharacterized epimerase/dehydratase SAV0553 n=1 Tax=Dermatophilus congolensis TaxID=1863 RepID=A0AA46GZL1_9MICO|nr:NAD(P)-dependent oxidoreductase [Dermatophilus congolensis]STD04534.1 Uncharacterized epimerase/dehydratase SAV0553 [Dermatophilus congolensis]